MAEATLDDVESALFAALQALHAAPATATLPFRVVDRWAGQVSHEHGVDEATMGRAPAALLAFESSTPEVIAETSDHAAHVVETHLFRVYVVVEDLRGDTPALKGTVGQPGVLRCARLVKEALTGLRIPNLFDGETVQLVGHRPWLVEAGVQHTHVVWFSARAALPEVTPATPGAPFVLQGQARVAEPDTDAAIVTVSPFSLD